MSHSYAQNHIHLVFSTKQRQTMIPRESFRRLWSYLAGICKNHGMIAFAVGGMEDHIHVLFRLPPTMTLAKAVTLLKSNSSKWMRERGTKFAWQEGYGAFSVSSSSLQAVIDYIDTQDEHHKKLSFEQEFVVLLRKHGVKFDPRRVLG